jgi:UDPglucose 6-dehydrogenase
MAKKIIDACDGNVEGKVIAILGLSFKPDTDDMRDAASLTILPFLQKNGAIIKAFDPEAMGEAENMLENIIYTEDSYSCVSNADIAVVLTEWDVFRALDMKKIKAALKFPVIVDLRNIYNPTTMNENNIKYTSIGRN